MWVFSVVLLFGGNCATVNLADVLGGAEHEDKAVELGGEGTECAIGVHEAAGIGTKSGAASAIPTDFTWTTFS